MEEKITANGLLFDFNSQDETVHPAVEFLEETNGVSFWRVRFAWDAEKIPEEIRLRLEFPAVELYSAWTPASDHERYVGRNWRKPQFESRLASFMPLLVFSTKRNVTAFSVALSDIKTPIRVGYGIEQYQCDMEIDFSFFCNLTNPMTSYETVLRVDRRPLDFASTVRSARAWYSDLGYRAAVAPDAARAPLYSTWYSYHQEVDEASLLRECRAARKLGMRTIIVDDGWQNERHAPLYDFVGDWRPARNKFRSMRGFVEKVHAIGMKVMLWFSVPFVGFYAKRHAEFEGKYLESSDRLHASILDPRYPETRAFTVSLYENAMREWDLDGLKLDFINNIRSNGEVREGMDFTSVEDATEQLLREIYRALTAIRPDALIEFRAPYMGPIVTAYSNMMRVLDCPDDHLVNRASSLDLRLTSDTCAVHSDMIEWRREEPKEAVATQLWGVLFSVPQISVRMAELTPEQRATLRNFLNFRVAHAEAIDRGTLTLNAPETFYSLALAETDRETVGVTFAENVFAPRRPMTYLVNLTPAPIVLKTDRRCRFSVTDCTGKRLGRARVTRAALTEVDVPLGGMLTVEQL